MRMTVIFNIFYDYLTEVPIHSWNDVTVVDVRIYLGVLHRENYNRSSISRFLSSLRSFYHFLSKEAS